MTELFGRRLPLLARVSLPLIVVLFGLYSLPFSTLRKENTGPIANFADWKISADHLAVSKAAMRLSDGGRILAADEIAGVISRFENHPRLVSTRGIYLDLTKPFFGEQEFAARSALYGFITNNTLQDLDKVRTSLRELDVSVVVLYRNLDSKDRRDLMLEEQYQLQSVINGYSIWVRNQREHS
ncbi:hypothetical protein GM658_23365 [Pseudoduganella eburnea]|uniref:Uncharacterized protein n=1 Tax=Massilia eburnea TaxID=1776165 RepID=A0A6L6QN98_9BURK|nr:hypothetical protein [Massilia eburnea]MTW13554.1 hypothetical protein [Massilia eburnea]